MPVDPISPASPATLPAVVPTTDVATTDAPPRVNPFQAVALLLASLANSLEGIKRPGQAPRWVRIVRVRQFSETDPVAKGVIFATDKLAFAITYVHRFTLQARDLLIQGDAAKALVEISAEFIKTVAGKEFINALEIAVGQEPSSSSPLAPVGAAMDTIVKIADKVPEPEDLDAIGKEIYRLLCIEQLALPLDAAAPALHVDIAKTGKIRLIQWGLKKPIATFILGSSTVSNDVLRLGSRRLPATGTLPSKSTGEWVALDSTKEKVFELDFNAAQGEDFSEVGALLKGLGYIAADAAIPKALDADLAKELRQFQKVNVIPVTGTLDNATVNRLLNLDYDGKNIKKAKPFNASTLDGFDATKNPV